MIILHGEHNITGKYNPPKHNGIDIGWSSIEKDNQVYANCIGTVYKILDHIPHGSEKGGGWGNYVLIKHPNGMYSRYAHLKENLPVKEGDIVDEKSVIGIMGESGRAYGRHLHFEVQTGASSSTRINPTKYVYEPIYVPTPKNEYYKVNTPKGLWLLDDNGKKVRVYPDGTVVKYIKDGYKKYGYYYYYIEVCDGGERGYMAEDFLVPTKKPEPTPTPTPVENLKVGDKVKIIGYGNSQASGKGKNTSKKAIGWERQVKRIFEGQPYPYQIGNKWGTTGFYTRDALEKID